MKLSKIVSLVTLAFLLPAVVCGALITPDAYDKLFLRCNGVTTTFVDSSTANPKTITANGNATQLPIKFNKSAGFFNGTTDYVDISNSTDFAFGTGAFTIEGFFNTGIAATAQTILDTRTAAANTTGLLVNIINSTGNKLCVTTATTARITGTTTLAKNTWYHFMVVGNGGANGARTIILYLDGVQEGSTYTNDYNFTDQTLRIGAIKAAAGTYMNGWMKELRISNVARTVAVPTAQYKSDSNTKLLMHFDNPAVSPLASAIAFDGAGDRLTTPDHADFDMTDWTVEYFTRFDATAAAYSTNRMWSIGDYNSGGMAFITSSGAMNLYINNTAHNFGTYTYVANKWYHFRFVKTGATIRMFIDGKQWGADKSQTYTLNPATIVTIGCWTGQTADYFKGSLREFRISNNVRDSGTDFTPSQTGFTVDANTKLYVKGDQDNGVGGNNSTDIIDTTGKTVTCVNDTKIKYTEDYRSCIFKDETGKFPYPVGSAKVDFFAIGSGVGSFGTSNATNISTQDSDDFNMTADHTLEGYFRITDTSKGAIIAVQGQDATNGWWFGYQNTAPHYRYYVGNSSLFDLTVSWTPLANTWYHFAATRYGNIWNIWANGSSIVTSTTAVTVPNFTGNFCVGADTTTFGNYTQGLLDNIRISKGVARYTATFNPPDDYSAPRVGKRKTNWFFFF